MKTVKSTLSALAFMLIALQASGQKVLDDWNGYVASKNSGGTGFINLVQGTEEKAAQTYHYSGPGKVLSVRVEGDNPGLVFGVPIRVSIFSVDSKGRPVSEISGANTTFQTWNTSVDVNFSSGVSVSNSFAVVVAIRSTAFNGQTLQIKYTGNGEGKGQDLASLAGSSTGGNWASAMTTFTKDGDFYLMPRMAHDIVSSFSASTQCAATSTSVLFTNTSKLTMDSMFNKIFMAGYSGSTKTYAWDFGDGSTSNAVSPSKTYTTAGSYNVRLITSMVGWNGSKSDTSFVKVSVGLTASATNVGNLSCFGNNTGRFTPSATGGTSPYQYSLNGTSYSSLATVNGLSAGTYTLYIKDALGCVATTSFTITEPTALNFSSLTSTNASCNNTDGGILAVGTGGTSPYQYKLSSGSYQTSGSFSSLALGGYTVFVKDNNGCEYSSSIVISNFASPSLTVSFNHVSCNGGNDGSITLSSSGGTGAVQYSINGGTSFQSSGTFSNLTAGKYSVLVKDAAGCGKGEVVTINEPGKIDFILSPKAATCFGKSDGSINVVSATGGIGKLSYSLNGSNYQSSSEFTGLKAGNYTVYVKDVASCLISKSVTVTEPTDIVSVKVITDAVCFGNNTGSININASGGTPDYSFSLDGSYWQATGDFKNMGAGTYQILIKDQNMCYDTVSATVNQPTQIVGVVTTTNSTCGNSNGSLLVVASGGTGTSYTYSLDGSSWITPGQFTNKKSGTYVVAMKDVAGCVEIAIGDIMDSNGPTIGSISKTNITCNGGNDGSITVNSVSGGTGTIEYSVDGANWQTSNQIRNLAAGSYTVLVRDANGCRSESSSITLVQPAAITIMNSVVNVTCFGTNNGSVTITASGGAGTMAYSIDGGVKWQSDKTFSNLYAGDYSVIVRDAGGCTNSALFNITQPSPVNISAAVLNVTCKGAANGELTINATGGKFPYTYSIGSGYVSGNSFKNLSGGSYTYYVKDANGCIVSKTTSIFEPTALVVNAIAANISCAGGSNGVISLQVTGGVYPYTYLWSNNATSEVNYNLAAGSYSVTVTDANGCKKTGNFTLTQPSSPLIINGVITNGDEFKKGSVDITVTGGVAPYSFTWSNGKTTEDIADLNPGVYSVTVRDAAGCVTTSQYTVGGTAAISVQELNNQIKMYPNPADNKVTVSVNGYKVQKISVVNNTGRVVYQTTPSGNVVDINTATFAPGVYFVQVQASGTTANIKLIITR
jgi:hypothetical protein